MKAITTERIPIKMWAESIEDSAMQQAKNLANMPYSYRHIAIMPDSHAGYGMPIGAVLATQDVIVPNAVGVDINCGMIAVKTDLKADVMKYHIVEDIMKRVERDIPVGFSQHKEKRENNVLEQMKDNLNDNSIVNAEYEKSMYQLGTLGGGNHFIEMDAGSDGYVWLMLHSGSRGIGNKVGTFYNKIAIADNEEHYLKNTVDAELPFLLEKSPMGINYIMEMQYCVVYANISRGLMMQDFIKDFQEVIPGTKILDLVRIDHNFVEREGHFGKSLWIHRKGAVPAFPSIKGIIAGSQGTSSYIVEGKGNKESFMTCSHGAGRVMGRKEAVRKLNLSEEQEKMKGIYNNMKSQQALDEAPSCYKDIDEVMRQQEDLVDILVKLTPLGVVKG